MVPMHLTTRTEAAVAMPAPRDSSPRVQLDREDAAELAQLLSLVGDWLEGPDAKDLAASFRRFARTGYDLDELRADLGSFVTTLG